jgi:hypothetical protein
MVVVTALLCWRREERRIEVVATRDESREFWWSIGRSDRAEEARPMMQTVQ